MSLNVHDDHRGRHRAQSAASRPRRRDDDDDDYNVDYRLDRDALLAARRDRSQPPPSQTPIIVNAYTGAHELPEDEMARLNPGVSFGHGTPSSPRRSSRYAGGGSGSISSSSPRASAGAFEPYYPPPELGRRREQSQAGARDRHRDRYDEDDLAYGKLPGPERHAVSAAPRALAIAPPPAGVNNPTYGDSPITYAGDGGGRPRERDLNLATGVKYGNVPRDRDPAIPPSPSSPSVAGILKKQHARGRSLYGDDPRQSAPSVLTVDPHQHHHQQQQHHARDQSRPRNSTLTVQTAHHSASLAYSSSSGQGPPPSPLLEAYRGTWQQASPLPSPLLGASRPRGGDTIPAYYMDALSASDDERNGIRRRHARFHDPEEIASRIANALRGDGRPDVLPLIEILPGLTHSQVMELRAEYKALVKTGPDRKGVNVAKHIRARLKDDDPSLMKACYATALGKWESEAYWANFWYQSDKTRRELLIESLFGRTNDEIVRIKASFSDKKYDNSLVRCMRTELREDKFKKAVMMVLEEGRVEEEDGLDYEVVDRDVQDLYRAVRAHHGGESSMISIVMRRSDGHLREVLKLYERAHGSNFARDALKKSGNLVGELLVHVLNGIINRPVRDAVLLHHALTASRKDPLRRELLISRLVRYHWDPGHFVQVKSEYAARYGIGLQQAVADATSGAWSEFCSELCITRMPDDVKVVAMER